MESRMIRALFEYNWKIREKWFAWCRQIPEEALLKERKGGYKGFLQTLFHIVDVEQRWLSGLLNNEVIKYNFADFDSLEAIIKFSRETQKCFITFFNNYTQERGTQILNAVNKNGENVAYLYIEILLHLAVHESHHVGQMSVWAREIGKEPVTANLIGLNVFNNEDWKY
ncbi:damage-inducible protein DinB [Bacillus sp. V3-13]|uniref:DinB family protein n=1 Tax=Bacillus sp. V3-13 TaxID=2053728 RepID=UPI000C76A6EB|nr:DinB family protein [Bacillus sp. V3-13]PLR78179.1 damage-inducible protein DinB [Bacillus sp. V3-13]